MLDGGADRDEVHTSAAHCRDRAIHPGDSRPWLHLHVGQVGAEPSDGAMVDGVAAQADRALRNLAAVLAEAGSSLERVVKTTIFLTDINDFAAVNEVYARYLSAPFPARSTVAVAALPKGALVEIEMVALLPRRGARQDRDAHRGGRAGRRTGDAHAFRLPKVLHPLAGRPMLDHVLGALTDAGVEQRVVVVRATAPTRSRLRSTVG